MNPPAYLAYVVLAVDIAIIVAILMGARAALARAGTPDAAAPSLRPLAALLVVWFAVALALAYAGVFRGQADRPPVIPFAIFLPIVIGLLLLWRSDAVRRLVDAVPLSWLVGIQVYRAVGVIFLLLLAEGRLSAFFALPAGVGDVTVGVLAPLVAWSYARGLRGRESLVRAWNVSGLLDLAIAVTMGFLTVPSPLQPAALLAPSSALLTVFPLAMVPAFAVPVSVILHAAALMKLRRAAVDTGARRHDEPFVGHAKAA
jgi:hypothetical protein